MKKWITIILCVVFTVGFVGCSSIQNSGENQITQVVSIEDASHSLLYHAKTEKEDIPTLSLSETYYLIVKQSQSNPNGQYLMTPYEAVDLQYDETQIRIDRVSGKAGEVYSLTGLLPCEDSKIEVFFQSAEITIIINVSFQ